MEMKKRLIDVLEFAKRCDRLLENPLHIHPGTSWQRGIEMAVVEAFIARPVDAVEVVHGRWIDTDYKPDIYCKCSVCGRRVYAYDDGYNYCPNCGAKMDGGNEDEKPLR